MFFVGYVEKHLQKHFGKGLGNENRYFSHIQSCNSLLPPLQALYLTDIPKMEHTKEEKKKKKKEFELHLSPQHNCNN